jgi:hypothetical protein
MFRRLLCLLGFHHYEKQDDPFGFGDKIDVCKHCSTMNCEILIVEIR